jgi:hypothetical protein
MPDLSSSAKMASSGQYHESLTSSLAQNDEHLGASLGVTAGYPFLSGNVIVDYDTKAMSSKDVCGLGHVFSFPTQALC